MAAPNKLSQIEDCRDFLRTGRCKYGASCKYNHPPNVQSGGGIKSTNPSEPQFPIRPDEPACQYYLKHGTCKFGQACKFHHPPQSEMTATLLGGSTVVMNVGRNNEAAPGQQIVLNSIGGASAMALQFLPQRPDEPDCIYFLRNGRCKYGATCRYHHPVTFHQGKQANVIESRRPQQQQQRSHESSSRLGDSLRSHSTGHLPDRLQGSQYGAAQQASSGYVQQQGRQQQRVSGVPASHFVVTETPLAVMAPSAPSSSTSYQYIARSNSAGLGEEYSVPLATGTCFSGPQDHASSSSSIASSYETASSALEFLPPSVQQAQQHNDGNNVYWSRPVKRIGSGGSLNAYDSTPPLRPQPAYGATRSGLVPSGSDNNIASRRRRAESMGSTSDYSAYQDAAWNSSSGSLSTAGRAWIEPNSSMDQPRRMRNPAINPPERKLPQDASGRPQQQRHGRVAENETHSDDGLSMMTSALLNMLETPEEAATKSYSQTSQEPQSMSSPPSTPLRGPVACPPGLERSPLPDRLLSPGSRIGNGRDQQSSRYRFTSEVVPEHTQLSPTYSPSLRMPRNESPGNPPGTAQGGRSPTWSPTWQGQQQHAPTSAQAASRGLEQNAQSMSVLQQPPNGSGSTSSNIGLYLS